MSERAREWLEFQREDGNPGGLIGFREGAGAEVEISAGEWVVTPVAGRLGVTIAEIFGEPINCDGAWNNAPTRGLFGDPE